MNLSQLSTVLSRSPISRTGQINSPTDNRKKRVDKSLTNRRGRDLLSITRREASKESSRSKGHNNCHVIAIRIKTITSRGNFFIALIFFDSVGRLYRGGMQTLFSQSPLAIFPLMARGGSYQDHRGNFSVGYHGGTPCNHLAFMQVAEGACVYSGSPSYRVSREIV